MKYALFLLATAACLPAQVAKDANATYRTAEQRKTVAAGLADPKRDEKQNPREIIRAMRIVKGSTVADVGTGIGYMLPFLSRAVGEQGKVVAEDIFDDFLAAARERVETQNLKNVSYVKGSETDPNLPAGQIDRVLVLETYHHFDYPDKMLAGILKALKPDGRLALADYYKRAGAMPDGRALTHIRLDVADVIKEVEANGFHLVMQEELSRDSQYLLLFEKK